MNALTALLTGERPPGVLRWDDETAVAEVRREAASAGWAFGHVPDWAATDKAGLLDALARALDLPDWFGRNFDALADSLRDLPGPTLLLWDGWSVLARTDRRSFDIALDVLRERAAGTEVPFAVLLRDADRTGGDVPTIGLDD